MKTVTITFKSEISTSELNAMLDWIADKKLDKIASNRVDWTIK